MDDSTPMYIVFVLLGIMAGLILICVAGIIWCVIAKILKRLRRTANTTPNCPEAPEFNSIEVPVQPSQLDTTEEQERPPRSSLSGRREVPVQTHLPSHFDTYEAKLCPPLPPRADRLSQIYQNVGPRQPSRPAPPPRLFQIDPSGTPVRPSQLQEEPVSQNIQLAVDTTVNLINELRERTTLEVADEAKQRISGAAKAGPDYPSFFLAPLRETSLPAKAKRHHIIDNVVTPESFVEGALRMSEKRARHINRNTVFLAPERWIAWSTKRGPRIVSSERVETVQCTRRGRQGDFVGKNVGKKYAIFRNGHLVKDESLQS